MKMMLLTLAALAVFAAIDTVATSPARAEDAGKTPTTAPDQSGPAKFYGTVSAVDTKAMTFTVNNQVYHVVAETHMTKASDNSKATLDDKLVGESARGTYTKASDGTLNVTKVRFGKKPGGGKANGKGGGGHGGAKKGEAATQPEKQ